MTDGLFDLEHTPPVEEPKLSPDRRRTQRQAEAITKGSHPLALIIGTTIRRHPGTIGQEYAATDPAGRDLTCGTCAQRETHGYHGRRYAKCMADGGRRTSSGAGTDCRSWWPACGDWEARSVAGKSNG